MSIPVPNLDDRNFLDLVAAARLRITATDPLWTDLGASEPGMVLVDAFAHLTDILLYRLNRVPNRLYAVFLNLLGTQLRAPCAAAVELQFTRTDATAPLTVPQGLRVTVARPDSGAAPVFVTTTEAEFAVGATTATASAVNADTHAAVVLGVGTGLPGQTVTLPSVPAVQGAVRIAVEADQAESPADGFIEDGRQFRDWQEAETFADAAPGDEVFLLDRVTGDVTFAPAVDPGTGKPPAPVAAVPQSGRQIRIWWQSGGGAYGNVDAGTLTVLRDPLAGVSVTNPAPAAGGRDTESVQDAMVRAPQDFHTRQRAVTARDYELLAAKSSGAVERARAFNRSSIWSFAQPGEVEVVLVAAAGAPPPNGAEQIRQQVLQYLQERAPLGVSCIVSWVKYKTVAVHARVVVRAEEDPDAVKMRIEAQLNAMVGGAPSAGPADAEAGFGATLRLSNLYRPLQQEEPGVQYVDEVWFILDDVPDVNVSSLAADASQPDTFFAGAGPVLFRTLNGGDGWEPSGRFPGEDVWVVAPYPPLPAGRPGALSRSGWVAVGTRVADRSRVYVTRDLGEQWDLVADVGWGISDLAWVERADGPVLLLAGTAGMYEVTPEPNATAVQVVVDPSQAGLGYYAVDSFSDYRGRVGVAAAAEGSSGVWMSDQAGASNTFFALRRPGDDIRALAMQYDGPVTYVWAARAVSNATDTGCVRLRIDDLTQIDHSGVLAAWETLDAGWSAGSCWALSFGGGEAYAASQTGGVMRMDLTAASPHWQGLGIDCGLPRHDDPPGLSPVQSVTVTGDGQAVLAGGAAGIYRLRKTGDTYESVSQRVVHDFVTLPATWLFQSGQHQIEVVSSPPGIGNAG